MRRNRQNSGRDFRVSRIGSKVVALLKPKPVATPDSNSATNITGDDLLAARVAFIRGKVEQARRESAPQLAWLTALQVLVRYCGFVTIGPRVEKPSNPQHATFMSLALEKCGFKLPICPWSYLMVSTGGVLGSLKELYEPRDDEEAHKWHEYNRECLGEFYHHIENFANTLIAGLRTDASVPLTLWSVDCAPLAASCSGVELCRTRGYPLFCPTDRWLDSRNEGIIVSGLRRQLILLADVALNLLESHFNDLFDAIKRELGSGWILTLCEAVQAEVSDFASKVGIDRPFQGQAKDCIDLEDVDLKGNNWDQHITVRLAKDGGWSKEMAGKFQRIYGWTQEDNRQYTGKHESIEKSLRVFAEDFKIHGSEMESAQLGVHFSEKNLGRLVWDMCPDSLCEISFWEGLERFYQLMPWFDLADRYSVPWIWLCKYSPSEPEGKGKLDEIESRLTQLPPCWAAFSAPIRKLIWEAILGGPAPTNAPALGPARPVPDISL